MTLSPRAVICDFDYTLADSSLGVIACVNGALTELGFASEPDERIRRTIGMSLPATLVELKGPAAAPRAAEFHRRFMRHADRVMVDSTVLYPWVPDMVATLSAHGLELAIVSTKYRQRIDGVLQREGLRRSLQVIVGGEDVVKQKPAPDALLLAIRTLDLSAREVVYVGDSDADGGAASAAGIPFVAVLSGVTPREHLERYRPIAVLRNAGELPALLGLNTSTKA